MSLSCATAMPVIAQASNCEQGYHLHRLRMFPRLYIMANFTGRNRNIGDCMREAHRLAWRGLCELEHAHSFKGSSQAFHAARKCPNTP